MRHVESVCGMQQDVRPAQVCVAPMGGDVFEATCEPAVGDPERTAAFAAPLTRGTREQLRVSSGRGIAE